MAEGAATGNADSATGDHPRLGPRIRRLLVSHIAALVAEWGALIGLLVYTFDRAGAHAVGIASFLSLTPYVLFAPLTASAAQRFAPARVRAIAMAGQAIGFGGAAVTAAFDGPVWLVVLATGAGFTAATTLRPANAVVLPALVRTSRELTRANVVAGYGDTLSLFVGPFSASVMLAVSGPVAVFAWCAALSLIAAAVAAPEVPHGPPAAGSADEPTSGRRRRLGGLVEPFTDIGRVLERRGARGVLIVVMAQGGLVGASDVIWVVIAGEPIDLGDAGPGVLSALFGAGSLLCAVVLGRAARRPRLAPLMLVSLTVVAAACFVFAASITVAAAVICVPLMGLNRSLLDLLSRVLLQRSAPPSRLASVFGAVETIAGIGLLSGSLLAQALLALSGPVGALVGVGATCVVSLVVAQPWLRVADDEADVPVVEMSLLSRLPVFAPLPLVSLEAVARHARPVTVDAGAVVIHEGDPGDCYYAVVDGEFEVVRAANVLRVLGRGAGFGEIALLADVPRTATVGAIGAGHLLAIDREPFLLAVTGHEPAHEAAWTVVHEMGEGHRRPDPTP